MRGRAKVWSRSPDGAQRNPGKVHPPRVVPDFAALHPGYGSRMTPMLRDYRDEDADAIVRVAQAAFAEFEPHFSDWPLFTAYVAKMPRLARTGEIIVAEDGGGIAGAVAYIGPRAPKPAFFDPAWPVIRMLVVDP